MGTHPIFESDFDCLTESMFRGAEKLTKFRIRGAKDVAFGLNARTEMLAGVNKLADAVLPQWDQKAQQLSLRNRGDHHTSQKMVFQWQKLLNSLTNYKTSAPNLSKTLLIILIIKPVTVPLVPQSLPELL